MRLFAAVWPPIDVRQRLRTLGLAPSPRLRLVPDGSWHVTLAFFGEVEDDAAIVAGMSAAASSVEGPVTVTLGPGIERLGRQVLSLPVRGVDEMAAAVRRETAAPPGPDVARFTGHVTVARGRGKSRVPLEAVGVAFEAAFDVTSISLVESTLSSDGPSYQDRATFPLGARDLP